MTVKHESFSALYAHFGPFGRQDVHYHGCFDHDRCDMVLVGLGRDCSIRSEHEVKKLTIAANAWQNRRNEGQPLTPGRNVDPQTRADS